MSKVFINETILYAIANALRTKLKTDDIFYPSEMPEAILQIGNQPIALNTVQPLKEGWKFHLESTISSNNNPTHEHDTDFSSWETVTVPHDWSIHLPFNSNSAAGYEGGYLDGGDGWYQRDLIICAEHPEQRYFIHFDGAYQITKVYVNGYLVGENFFGYNPFTFEITDRIIPGMRNSLVVFVRNQQPSSRWYSGSGLYRNVELISGRNIDVGLTDVYITTPNLKTEYTAGGNVSVHVSAEATGSFNYKFEIFDQEGHKVFTQNGTHEEGEFAETFSVPRPQLWEVYNGVHYFAQFTISDGADNYICGRVPFGYRYIEYDNTGFYLNGERTFLKGVCMHHDLGALGAAVNRSAIDRQIKTLKSMGCNAIRFAHNPPCREYLEACMEEGMMCIGEFFDTWTSTKKTYDFHNYFTSFMPTVIETVLKRDRNNPAIIMWSIGNEIIRTSGSYDATRACEIAQSIIDEIHKWDNRPTTMGDDTPQNGVSIAVMALLDIIGVNYGNDTEYNYVKNKYPNKCIYGSETTSALSTRGKYARDEENLYCSSLDNDKVSWGDTARDAILRHMGTQDNAGMFVWTGFDYIGEPTPFNRYSARSSYFGIVDLAGFPKDAYWIYKTQWTNDEFVHIVNGADGYTETNTVSAIAGKIIKQVTATYLNSSNFGSFTPILNTSTYGNKFVSNPLYSLTIDSTKQYGGLSFRTYDTNSLLLSQYYKYPYLSPRTLQLKSDKVQVNKNDDSLIFITCNMLDKNGVFVKNATNTIIFSAIGGEVIATDNGDSASTASFQTATKDMFSGKVLAIVRPNKNAGTVIVSANSTEIYGASVEIAVGNSNIYAEDAFDFEDDVRTTLIADFEYLDDGETYSCAYVLPQVQTFNVNTSEPMVIPSRLSQTLDQEWSMLISLNCGPGALTDENRIFSSPEFDLFNNQNTNRIAFRFRDVRYDFNLSTADSSLRQLYFVKQGNSFDAYDLLTGEHKYVSSAGETYLDPTAESSLGMAWDGTIQQLQIFDDALTTTETMQVFPDAEDFSVVSTLHGTVNEQIIVSISNIVPALSIAKLLNNIQISSTNENIVISNNNTTWYLSSAVPVENAPITVSYGNLTKTCYLTVEAEAVYEDESLIYSLPATTTFVDSEHQVINTNQALLNAQEDFTIYFEFQGSANNQQKYDTHTMIHCMTESGSWPGMSFQIDSYKYVLHWWKGIYNAWAYNDTNLHKVLLVHDAINKKLTVYADGSETPVANLTHNYSYNIPQTLIIGGYQLPNGTKGRYWNGTMYKFDIYNEKKTPADIEGYLES